MKVPNIDLKKLKKFKEKNFKERLDFIDGYVKWLKCNDNKKWSSEHKRLFD